MARLGRGQPNRAIVVRGRAAATDTPIVVPAGSLTLTGLAPVVLTPRTIAVPAGSLTITGFAPTVATPRTVAVPAGALVVTGFAPTVTATQHQRISVPAGSLVLTGYPPTVVGTSVTPEARATGAGRPRRRRYVVEVDGEDFVVESVDEAQALLEEVQRAAQDKAAEVVERARRAQTRPVRKVVADARKALEPPRIDASPELSSVVTELLQRVQAIYANALRDVEIAVRLRDRERALEEDDEEILLLL